jgi:hypothetical protein
MFVCCECCVMSSRGLCDELITRQEESYRLWCVVVCDLESSGKRRSWPTGGFRAKKKKAASIIPVFPKEQKTKKNSEYSEQGDSKYQGLLTYNNVR